MTMARKTGGVLVLCGLVAVGAAIFRVVDAAKFDPGDQVSRVVAQSGDASDHTAQAAPAITLVSADATRPYLPIFGVRTPAPVVTEKSPDIPAPARFDYALKGLIASGKMKWAVFSGDEGDVLAREGEKVGPSAVVDKIHAEGVDLTVDGEPISITFSDSTPVTVMALSETPADPASSAAVPGAPKPTPQHVIFQNMSRSEVLAALRKAEDKRRARGWVTMSE